MPSENHQQTERNAPGRRRDPDIDEAILTTTLDHLGRIGFTAMSIAGIARDAGVTKPAIYRRWSCKADLATAALSRLQAAEGSPSTGSLRGDLIALLDNFQGSLTRPQGLAMIGMLLSEESRMPELIAHFRERITTQRRAMFREAFERAQPDELPPGFDVDAAVNMLIGSLYAKYIADGSIPKRWAARVVDTLLPQSET
ncbi:TetR/AcrR family transcriptional regulator [Engelhardtia mirabilis]|uniref:Bacterial regulatory protein, tetR family n=1 Tax=Engelhardtia mirabilis TaxID=2528011 RepID=A0A518BIE9_9BACT|nr:Bacterial regulatory protein, tetR family [Planctomycetes bacterium Pla133]QDV01071.1 Bacterial regulatory protein, tetR family [Planctomycetes bacterium Pla86]